MACRTARSTNRDKSPFLPPALARKLLTERSVSSRRLELVETETLLALFDAIEPDLERYPRPCGRLAATTSTTTRCSGACRALPTLPSGCLEGGPGGSRVRHKLMSDDLRLLSLGLNLK